MNNVIKNKDKRFSEQPGLMAAKKMLKALLTLKG